MPRPIIADADKITVADFRPRGDESHANNQRNLERWANNLPLPPFDYPADPTNNQVWAYNSTTGFWEPVSIDTLTSHTPWTAFTPTVQFGGTTATLSVNDSRYTETDKRVRAEYRFRCSNLNAGAGNLTISTPTTMRLADGAKFTTDNSMFPLGMMGLRDMTGGAYFGICRVSTTTAFAVCDNGGAVGAGDGGATYYWSNTAPITIAVGGAGTGDEFWGWIDYESTT